MKKVYLEGTQNESKWRNTIISLINIDAYAPQEDIKENAKQRNECGYYLHVITPRTTGVDEIARAVDDSNKYPEQENL